MWPKKKIPELTGFQDLEDDKSKKEDNPDLIEFLFASGSPLERVVADLLEQIDQEKQEIKELESFVSGSLKSVFFKALSERVGKFYEPVLEAKEELVLQEEGNTEVKRSTLSFEMSIQTIMWRDNEIY